VLCRDGNHPAHDTRGAASAIVRRQRLRAVSASRLGLCDRCVAAAGARIAADVYVVFLKITHSSATTIAASLLLLLAMLGLWYFYPIWLRTRRA
jgi:hypothetical protein